jgi:hypothetical protein
MICSPSPRPSIVFRSPMQLQSIMQKIDGILPEIEEMQRRGLIEIQNLNSSGKARVISAPIFSETESRSTFTKAEVAPKIEQSVVAAKIQFCVRNSKRLEKLRIIVKVKFDADKMQHKSN